MPAKKKLKTTEPSTIVEPPDSEPLTETVEAKHTIAYVAPFKIPASTLTTDNDDDFDDDDFDDDDFDDNDEKEKPIKPAKNSVEKIRQRLAKAGVFPENNYPLIIERLMTATQTGLKSLRSPCTRITVTEEQLIAGEHIPVVESFGPGRYWLVLRTINGQGMIRQWEHIVGTPDAIPSQPSQSPLFGQMPTTQPDIYQEVEKAIGLLERFDSIRGFRTDRQPAAQPDAEMSVASLLLKNPQTAKQMARNLLGSGGDESLATTIVQNVGPIAEAVSGIITLVFANIQALKDGSAQPQQMQRPLQQPTAAQPGEASQPINHAHAFSSQLVAALNKADLATLSAKNSAYEVVAFSDEVDKAGGPAISHFIEAIARQENADAISLLEELSQLKLTVPGEKLLPWLTAFRKELLHYFAEPQSE